MTDDLDTLLAKARAANILYYNRLPGHRLEWWTKPMLAEGDLLREITPERIIALVEERKAFEGLWEASQKNVRELRARIRALEEVLASAEDQLLAEEERTLDRCAGSCMPGNECTKSIDAVLEAIRKVK